MKLREVIVEDPNSATGSNDYEQMQAFVRANRVQGIPPEQQVALALFKELKKQKQQNAALSDELNDAERRIDQATQSGKAQGQEIGMHRGELEKERKRGEQQKAEVGKLGQAYAEREQASQEQIQDITAKLDAVKTMPGVGKEAAEKLEKQIQDLTEKGLSAEHVEQLEQSIAAIQSMQVADEDAIKDLVNQINDAEKVKKELGKNLETTSKNVNDQIAQIQQQLAHLKDVEQTVATLSDTVGDVNQEFDLTAKAVYDLDHKTADLDQKTAELDKKVSDIGTAYGQRAVANDTTKMIRQQPQQAAQAQRPPAFDPRVTAQRLVDKGVLQSVDEQQMFKAISWATGK